MIEDVDPHYRGTRRLPVTGRTRLLIAGAAAAVVALGLVAFLVLRAGDPAPARSTAQPLAPTLVVGSGSTPVDPPASASALPSVTPSRSPSARPSARSSVSPSPSRSTSAPTGSYEAEASGNRLPGALRVVGLAGASGGKYVSRTATNGVDRLTITGIRVSATADYTVTVYYLTAQDRTTLVYSTSGGSLVGFPGTGSAERIGSTRVTLRLVGGTNESVTIGIVADGPGIDRITVR